MNTISPRDAQTMLVQQPYREKKTTLCLAPGGAGPTSR
jgi:hypothetical protein